MQMNLTNDEIFKILEQLSAVFKKLEELRAAVEETVKILGEFKK